MSAKTSWVRDVTRDQRDMADDQCARLFQVKVARKNCIRHSVGLLVRFLLATGVPHFNALAGLIFAKN